MSRTSGSQSPARRLPQNADWLPAIEQFGEGIFVHSIR